MAALMPENGRPKAVLLDAGGVLLLPNPWAVAATLRAAGGRPDLRTLHRAHYSGIAAMDRVGQADWRLYFANLADVADVPADRRDDAVAGLAALFGAPVYSLWNVVPDGVIENLQHLAATGVAIAVVSNADGLVEETLRRCEVPVEVVIDSTVVGYAKPDPEIFRIALNRLGISADRVVHVGDMALADVDGARAAGIHPLHLDPYGDCPHPPGAHAHIRSLAEVVELVRG
ncbi:MAG: HAD-IA family hydrolase [Acidothermus cellulolyticus]|jgi:putative hydrolase of the HAD superfamily|nr:HAD-IA family hydrolase [Acidothermus cellulolyticus]